MKKFLSFLLAVLMIVSVMVPMLTLLVSAEGDADENETPEIVSDFPELVISEYHANAVYYSNVYNTLIGGNATEETKFLASTMYPKGCGEVLYAPTYVAVGASVGGLYVKNVDWVTGEITFDPAGGTAVEGVQYHRRYNFTGNDNEIVEFIEVYNSGSEPINLYDYQIVRDKDAFKHGDVPMYIDLYGGPLAAAAHGQYFKKAGNITAFDPSIAYYTKRNEYTYVPVNPNGTPDPNTTYYYEVPEGAFVDNPSEEEGAWLQPGQVAVLWNFTYRDWQYNITEEIFKAYFSTAYGFGQNWDDILFLGMDGNHSETDRYIPKKQTITDSEMSEGGCVRIGIVHDDIAAEKHDDTMYDTDWVSWVLHAYYFGINYNGSFALQNTVIGVTKVTEGGYLVYDQKRDEYVPVSQAAGTADKKGCAVAGVQYYKASAAVATNGTNSRSVAYLYGLDASANIKEGRAYTNNSAGVSPGVLDNIQEAVFPNYSRSVEELSKTPRLVITEVVPDNGKSDAYEYIEVLNVSGAPLNVFDYTFVGHPDNISHYNEQYFSKVSPIIPGDYGSILASTVVTKYQEGYAALAPTNVSYQNGWLQPGEAALLWMFTPNSYTEQATFDKFRSHYKIDESVKVFAIDGDGTNGTGRPHRQDLQDTGLSMYGVISNDKLMWSNNKYTSDPVLQAITYSSGLTRQTTRGVNIRDCESFVLCAALHVAFANATIGTDYGYQYVWGNTHGTTNKCGSYLRMSYASSCGGQDFSGTGSVVTDAWKASPGKLIAEQKTGLATNANKDRYIVYMQDFNGYGTITGYDAVAAKLGLSGINDAHSANVEATESKGVSFLEIRDGKLYVNNKGSADDYMTLLSDDVLSLLDDQSFTIEYAMTYNEKSMNNQNGYSGILYSFDANNMTYGAPIVRVSGYGNNAISLGDGLIDIDGGEGSANSMANKDLPNDAPLTLYERLYGDIDSIDSFFDVPSLDSSSMLAGKPLTVRIDVDRENGVTVTVNGVAVYSTTDLDQWNQFLETKGTDLVLATSANISASYDYITVYTDGDAIRSANEGLYGNGFMITEFHKPTGEGAAFKAMEITNVSDIPMNLYNAMIVTTSAQTGNGVLQTWNHAIKMTAGCPVSSYDPLYKSLKHISNPNSCMVQPGESVVVWLMSNIGNYADENGNVTINTNDFRNYYNDLGNTKLTELDEKGNPIVKVVMAYDSSASDNHLQYALAKKNNTYYTNSNRSYFPEVFSTIVPQSDAEYSLGYLSQSKYGLIAALKFTHMGEIVEKDNDGNVTNVINAYVHQSVLNGLTDAGVKNTSASVSASSTGASISFRAAVNTAYYNRMVELFGEDNVNCGILIARADSAMEAFAMRPYLLEAASVSYIDDNEGLRSATTSAQRTVYSNAHAVDAGYYAVTYSAVAYWSVETQAFGTITKYAENAYHQSAKQVAAAAMMQYVDTATAKAEMAANPGVKYYEISAGKWSLYTREQIARLDVLCK
ncbi:MAG: hypothetical protein J6B09_03600 [Clostridia bacterium]|nr:hypothetical protein [Clostridia bacterium]